MSKSRSREFLADVLRAEVEGQDLQEGPHGIHVCGMKNDGTLYEIGFVSLSIIFQDPVAASAAISRIKFAGRGEESES